MGGTGPAGMAVPRLIEVFQHCASKAVLPRGTAWRKDVVPDAYWFAPHPVCTASRRRRTPGRARTAGQGVRRACRRSQRRRPARNVRYAASRVHAAASSPLCVSVPIGADQTISQPSLVAFMTESLDVNRNAPIPPLIKELVLGEPPHRQSAKNERPRTEA